MYTREQIIFESEYNAYIEKLSVTTDMLCENCINIMQTTDDADVYMEAKTGLIATLGKFIEGLIKKLREAYDKLANKFKEHKNKKEVEALYDPAFKRKIANAKKNGVNYIEYVDVDELVKILKQSEEFILKSADELKREAAALKRSKSLKNKQDCTERLNKLTLSLDKKYDEIARRFEKCARTKTQIPLSRIEAMAKQGFDYTDQISDTCDKFATKLDEFQSVVNEVYGSVEKQTASAERGGGIKQSISLVYGWTKRHRDMLDMVEDIIRGFAVSVGGFGGWAAAQGTIRGGKMFLRSVDNNYMNKIRTDDVLHYVNNKGNNN